MKSFTKTLTAQFWYALTTPELPGYHPAVAFVAVGEVLCHEALCAYLAVVALLFVQRRRSFPFHFVACTAIVTSYLGLDATVAAALHITAKVQDEGWLSFARALIWALVWCAYVMRSVRARETFVRGARPPRKPPVSADTEHGASRTPQRAKDPYLLALPDPDVPRAVEGGGEGPEGRG